MGIVPDQDSQSTGEDTTPKPTPSLTVNSRVIGITHSVELSWQHPEFVNVNMISALRDGYFIGSNSNINRLSIEEGFTDTGLKANTQYCYSISASSYNPLTKEVTHKYDTSEACTSTGSGHEQILQLLFPLDSAVDAQVSPIISSDGTVYIGTLKKELLALTAAGVEKWKYATDDYIRSNVSLSSSGRILFGDFSGKIYSLEENGTLHSSFSVDASVWSPPAIDENANSPGNGSVYVVSRSGTLFALNLSDLTEKWQAKGTGNNLTAPVVGKDGSVYVVDMQDIYGFTHDGTLKWIVGSAENFGHLSATVAATPVIDSNNILYVVSIDGNLQAMDTGNGTLIWSYKMPGTQHQMPILSPEGKLYSNNSDTIYSFNLNAQDPSIPITVAVDFAITKPLTLATNGFYTNTISGFTAYDNNGQVSWKYAAIMHSPHVSVGQNNLHYYINDNYNLVGLDIIEAENAWINLP